MHNEPYILLLAVAGPIWTDQDGQTPRACATRTTQRPSSHVTQQRRQVATVPFIHVAKFLWPSLATFARAIDLARAPCEPVGLPPSGGVARDNSAISPGSLQYINVCKSVSMHVCVCMFVCVCVCASRGRVGRAFPVAKKGRRRNQFTCLYASRKHCRLRRHRRHVHEEDAGAKWPFSSHIPQQSVSLPISAPWLFGHHVTNAATRSVLIYAFGSFRNILLSLLKRTSWEQ